MMFATMSTNQTATDACQSCAQSLPFSHSSMPVVDKMYMVAASMLLLGTGAIASVSLFVVVLLVVALLLVSLMVVMSLLLTCLTGPISLLGLVGQTQKRVRLATGMTQGE